VKTVEFQIAITGSFPVNREGDKEAAKHRILKAIEDGILPLRETDGVELGFLVMNVGEPPWKQQRS
jgi:hypothetical protein